VNDQECPSGTQVVSSDSVSSYSVRDRAASSFSIIGSSRGSHASMRCLYG
jgi:hypothetical protein